MSKYTEEQLEKILNLYNNYCLDCSIVVFGNRCPLCKSYNTTLKLKKKKWYNLKK